MTDASAHSAPLPAAAANAEVDASRPRRPLPLALIKLARPHQWTKSAFVLLGPVYGLLDKAQHVTGMLVAALVAAGAFALASSACYVVNDLLDAPRDRLHPRKRFRPIAAGEVSPPVALGFAAVLAAGALALVGVVAILPFGLSSAVLALTGLVMAYVLNVSAYSLALKHKVIADVMCLSIGFVLRVLGGCAAAGVAPSTWLLNVTLFLSMFLAFGKRLGERRTMGENAAMTRGVQAIYSDDLLRLAASVSAVATLVTYSGYVQSRGAAHDIMGMSINVLWPTMLPATYALLRALVLLERGTYDDPTEIFLRDRAMQIAVLAFGAMSGLALAWSHLA
jgi:decaprenyl-phosphate phosphoribosyltransferase